MLCRLTFDRHQAGLRKVRLHPPALTAVPTVTAQPEAVLGDMPATLSEAPVIGETRRQARFAEVRALRQQGWSRSRSARQLRMRATRSFVGLGH